MLRRPCGGVWGVQSVNDGWDSYYVMPFDILLKIHCARRKSNIGKSICPRSGLLYIRYWPLHPFSDIFFLDPRLNIRNWWYAVSMPYYKIQLCLTMCYSLDCVRQQEDPVVPSIWINFTCIRT